mmetsp:Transcript_33253/g.99046  ORF Transcript_33253/g.99046 Transcript_33253/m.99046 type:complete len:314 (+) Transcript_33253:205-1146(+)
MLTMQKVCLPSRKYLSHVWHVSSCPRKNTSAEQKLPLNRANRSDIQCAWQRKGSLWLLLRHVPTSARDGLLNAPSHFKDHSHASRHSLERAAVPQRRCRRPPVARSIDRCRLRVPRTARTLGHAVCLQARRKGARRQHVNRATRQQVSTVGGPRFARLARRHAVRQQQVDIVRVTALGLPLAAALRCRRCLRAGRLVRRCAWGLLPRRSAGASRHQTLLEGGQPAVLAACLATPRQLHQRMHQVMQLGRVDGRVHHANVLRRTASHTGTVCRRTCSTSVARCTRAAHDRQPPASHRFGRSSGGGGPDHARWLT